MTEETSLFDKIKSNVKYDEKKHCRMILSCFSSGGTLPDFLIQAGISRQKFMSWITNKKNFRECYLVAKEMALSKWLQIGSSSLYDKDFKQKVWEIAGRVNFGPPEKIQIAINPESTPYEQYQQILAQASCGELTSGEVKQLMESVNIGIRAYETCLLQAEIDELKEGLRKMEERELEYQAAN